MDIGNIDTNTSAVGTQGDIDTNTSNIIVMTPEMCVIKCMTQEKNNMKNIISSQSNEIGRLLQEVSMWKSKYEEVMGQII